MQRDLPVGYEWVRQFITARRTKTPSSSSKFICRSAGPPPQEATTQKLVPASESSRTPNLMEETLNFTPRGFPRAKLRQQACGKIGTAAGLIHSLIPTTYTTHYQTRQGGHSESYFFPSHTQVHSLGINASFRIRRVQHERTARSLQVLSESEGM